MVFVVIFAGDIHPLDEVRLGSSTATAMATVTDVRDTNSTENDVTVYEYRFTFRAKDETEVTGRSYSTGRIWAKGERVPVTYLPDKPGVAQLQDTRHTEFPWWVALLVGIFPFIGGVMLLAGALGGWRQIRLLRMGRLAYARWINVTPTNMSVNDQPVMKYAFEFQAEDGQTYQGNSKSLPKAQLGDEANEPVLYWPTKPDRSMLLDAAAGALCAIRRCERAVGQRRQSVAVVVERLDRVGGVGRRGVCHRAFSVRRRRDGL